MNSKSLIDLTAEIVSAHAENNAVAAAELPALIQSVYAALATLREAAAPEDPLPEPAVPVRSSVKPDAIACLECGAQFKTLKRHLSRAHGLAPADYRDRWNLRSDYPMIAPSYAAVRSKLAVNIGLGRKPRQAPAPSKAALAGKSAARPNLAGAPKVAAMKPARRKKLGLFNGGKAAVIAES